LRYAVDCPQIGARSENEPGFFSENRLAIRHYPIHLDVEFASVFAIDGPQDSSMHDRAVGMIRIRLYAIGVVPEIYSIDIPVSEPQPNVVRMVHTLAGSGIERESTSDNRACRRSERIEDRLLDGVGPDVGGKRLPVDRYIDAMRRFIHRQVYTAL